ncbi:MAG: polymer-forming cytoskeletal protein [Helicobacter apodemus]|nr:polymer-forming cytoskeletal protein [Helicobacter apodemus]
MAIFTNGDKQSVGNSGNTSIIAQGTRIKGDILSECNLHIDGNLEGGIIAKNNVIIGKNGNVNGNINTEHLVVSGKVMGSCTCNIIEILPQGRIEGEIIAKELIIEKTGELVGQSIVHKGNEYKNVYDAEYKQSFGAPIKPITLQNKEAIESK